MLRASLVVLVSRGASFAPGASSPPLYEDFYYWMSFVNVEYGRAECVAALVTLVVARHKDDADKGDLRLENPISRDAKHLAAVSRVSRGLRSTVYAPLSDTDSHSNGFSFRPLLPPTEPRESFSRPSLILRVFHRFLVNKHRNWFGDVSQRRLVSPANCLTFQRIFRCNDLAVIPGN